MYNEEMKIMFSLDLDLRPSSLLVGEDDNPVDFEWTCEVTNLKKARFDLKCQTSAQRV